MAYLAPIVRARATAILLAAGLAALLVACGGGDDESEGTGCAASGEPNAKGQVTIIAAETKDAGDVVADAACQPLYVNDVDTDKRVSCTGECARVWIPITIPPKGSVRTEMPQQVGVVSLVKRPDGDKQVTLGGKPLYRFSGDDEEGATKGDGVSDTFSGVTYAWSVLTVEEAASQAPAGPGTQAPPAARKPRN